MPTLFVLGGANGAGKTTWHSLGLKDNLVPQNLPFINVDLIQKELGAYSTENAIKAEGIARNRMKELISGRQDFMIESNLAKKADYEWLSLLRRNGYDTKLFFLGTESCEINFERVKERVAEGGHRVPEPIIEQRYRTGLSYLKSEILLFTEAYLFDVTDKLQQVAFLKQGRIVSKASHIASWANDVLFLAQRMTEKSK